MSVQANHRVSLMEWMDLHREELKNAKFARKSGRTSDEIEQMEQVALILKELVKVAREEGQEIKGTNPSQSFARHARSFKKILRTDTDERLYKATNHSGIYGEGGGKFSPFIASEKMRIGCFISLKDRCVKRLQIAIGENSFLLAQLPKEEFRFPCQEDPEYDFFLKVIHESKIDRVLKETEVH